MAQRRRRSFAVSEHQYALNTQKTTWQLAMKARDLMAAQVRGHLRSLLKELSVRLNPLDERWTAFGFNKPGAKGRPETPTNVTVVSVAENALRARAVVQWDKAPRAEYYRVRVKVVGVDVEAKVVGTPADADFMLEELPLKAEVEVTVSAVAAGRESRHSEVVKGRVSSTAVVGLGIADCPSPLADEMKRKSMV